MIFTAMNPHFNVPRLTRITEVAACLLLTMFCCRADDLPRLRVSVTKKTIPGHTGRVFAAESSGRVQGLVVSVTNQSIRALPAGVVRWTAVVQSHYGEMMKYSGKDDLPPLLSFKSLEILCGSFRVAGRLDYEVVILHNGKESYRTESVSNFAALAEKAQPMNGAEGEGEHQIGNNRDERPPRPEDNKPPQAPIIGAEKMPPPVATPIVEIAKPAAVPLPVPQRNFDFFNLGEKKAPRAN